MSKNVSVIGAGLAGCEAAFQLAERGIPVTLYEMKPLQFSPAHHNENFAELVCSNSFRADKLQNAVGLLKAEMRAFHSLIMEAADANAVPAGAALAVDRNAFSDYITKRIQNHPNIQVVAKLIEHIPDTPTIIATGPLTDGVLFEEIEKLTGQSLHFYDAAAPIVTYDSLNHDIVFRASRYDKGGNDYLNCPLNREEYFRFYQALIEAETAPLHEFETPRVFEGCMPVEIMAKRGQMTLAFGPLKPVGLKDPRTDSRPFAVVQLRQDNSDGTLYNIVGFQTNLKFSEQKRVFSLIPGLENLEIVRYGVMHRNTFLNSPGTLDVDFQLKEHKGIYFAGQITGVEGYVESAASGLVAGIQLARQLQGYQALNFTPKTALGALAHYVSNYAGKDFQPMNITFGIMDPLQNPPKNKLERYSAIAQRALEEINKMQLN